MSDLIDVYESIKEEINQKQDVFRMIWNLGDEEIFSELLFCLCTPQSNAHNGWKAVKSLSKIDLKIASQDQIEEILSKSGVRFKKNKAKYIASAIQQYSTIKNIITILINNSNGIIEARNWIADNIYGLGMKEASHFLRNIGFGDDICILDRHILRNLVEYRVIDQVPRHINKKLYLEIEQKMIQFSKEVNIPLFALDFVFWYLAKGELFK